MRKNALNTKGFGLTGVLVIVAALVVVGGAGAYMYHHNHKSKAVANTVTTSAQSSKSSSAKTSTSAATPTDPYEGWKTYCDSTYHYCFRYPTDWTLDQTVLLSPSKNVRVAYANPDERDGGVMNFTPSYVGQASASAPGVTVVGGYYSLDGGYSPTYLVADSSNLQTFPLTVGQAAKFPGNATFTDAKATGVRGQLISVPMVTNASYNALSDAQAWLNSVDAKTSLQIVQSIYYQS